MVASFDFWSNDASIGRVSCASGMEPGPRNVDGFDCPHRFITKFYDSAACHPRRLWRQEVVERAAFLRQRQGKALA